MTRRESQALDRHITGNYGEDQFPIEKLQLDPNSFTSLYINLGYRDIKEAIYDGNMWRYLLSCNHVRVIRGKFSIGTRLRCFICCSMKDMSKFLTQYPYTKI